MVHSWYKPKNVIFGAALCFILLGLFIFFIDPKIKKGRRIVSIIILVLGVGASFLIGYRGGDPSSPWIWNNKVDILWILEPWIEWVDMIIPLILFPLLSLTLWFYDYKLTKLQQVSDNKQEEHIS
ncbi:MAG: hypothetical protein LBM99_05595 [Bacillales bacterium]|jgi:hypothetical protein|nr:hypothetical protein [Bacillales bacterium]